MSAALALALLLGAGTARGAEQSGPSVSLEDSRPDANIADVADEDVPEELAPFQGRPVRRVVFRGRVVSADPRAPAEWTALEPELEQLGRNQLRLREGAPFSHAQVLRDLRRLNRLGRFRDVASYVTPLTDGGVELRYDVRLQPLVSAVEIIGNTVITDQDLQRELNVLVGTPVDRDSLDRSARRIETLYRERGYYNARVTLDEQELELTGAVILRVREGAPLKVTRIDFRGNTTLTDAELRDQIETTTAWAIEFLERGELDNAILEDDVASVVQYYKDRGYIEVRCATIVTPSADGREAIVEFVIEEGPVAVLRGVRVEYAPGDDQVFSAQQLEGMLTLRRGDVFSERLLRSSEEAVRAAYGKLGYADVRVSRRAIRSGTGPEVDLLLSISEGRRFRTGLIEVVGNTITRDSVIRRQISLQPGRPMDATEAKESEDRLKRSRLFDLDPRRQARVAIQPESPENPGVRDVVVEVTETNTGSFNVGAAAGSDGGVTGIISLTQRNFDVTDTPDTLGELFTGEAFRGGGQTLQLQAEPGDRVRQFSISLSDPSIDDSDISGSARVFWRERLFRGYDEQRYGASFSVGRRFGSLWNISVPFRVEQVELSDIDADAPRDYFEVEDARLLNSVGISLSRSNVDRPVFPTRGTNLEFSVDQFGLLGDDTFTRVGAEWARYFELEQDVLGRSTTLQLRARAGYIPGSENEAPFYERLFLGGQNFRGFAFRGASPVGIRNDNGALGDDPVGGNWMFFAGAEVIRPVFQDVVAGVLFVDSGTVEPEVGFDQYRVSVGFGLRLYVEQLSGVPLAFDFGFPIVKEETDRERFFTFSIDVPF